MLQEIKSLQRSCLHNHRGDYTYFMKLTYVLLTGDTEGFRFQPVGAVSDARWMAKTNVASMIVLLRKKIVKELPKNCVVTAAQLKLIIRFVKFAALIYAEWWIRCPLPAERPLMDISIIKAVTAYSDKTVSTAALGALKNHLWYVTQEMSPLAIFSP